MVPSPPQSLGTVLVPTASHLTPSPPAPPVPVSAPGSMPFLRGIRTPSRCASPLRFQRVQPPSPSLSAPFPPGFPLPHFPPAFPSQLVDTVGHEETQTNAQVEQSSTVSATAAQPAELLALIRQLTGSAGYKIVVFFTTARLTQLYSELFEALGFSILEMHSRKSQPHRNRMADQVSRTRLGLTIGAGSRRQPGRSTAAQGGRATSARDGPSHASLAQ